MMDKDSISDNNILPAVLFIKGIPFNKTDTDDKCENGFASCGSKTFLVKTEFDIKKEVDDIGHEVFDEVYSQFGEEYQATIKNETIDSKISNIVDCGGESFSINSACDKTDPLHVDTLMPNDINIKKKVEDFEHNVFDEVNSEICGESKAIIQLPSCNIKPETYDLKTSKNASTDSEPFSIHNELDIKTVLNNETDDTLVPNDLNIASSVDVGEQLSYPSVVYIIQNCKYKPTQVIFFVYK